MAAPVGNTNASKSKPWSDAIRLAIARHDRDKSEDQKVLNLLATQLLADCLNGDKSALDELTVRLDGKPAQAVEQTIEHSGAVQHAHVKVPDLTVEEWMAAHGLGTPAGAAK